MPQAHSRHANASRKWREATESASDEDEPFSDHEDEPFSDYEDEEERQEPRRRLKRRRFPRQDTGPWESDLYKQFESGFFENADGPGPALFREETRMPFAIFKEILESARQAGFAVAPNAKAPMQSVPLECKVWSWCRTLARGPSFHDDARHCRCSKETLRSFFHKFNEHIATMWLPRWVRPPLSRAEVDFQLACYCAWGLPGCIGSTDCVHVAWDRCPAAWRSTFCGS